MNVRRLGATGIDVFPLCLGGNPFGWTANERESFAVLDAYAAAGGNFIDTADAYWQYAPGRSGGESETIIGRWMAARGNRDQVVVATKVGRLHGREGLSAANVRAALEDSLRRLRTDHVELYYAHLDDPEVPLEETLGTFKELVDDGLIGHVAASGYSVDRLAAALEVADRDGLARYVAVQLPYNLVTRDAYEGPMAELCERERLACLPYFGLAMGFLTGKYRRPEDVVGSPRRKWVEPHLGERGLAILAVLDELAGRHQVPVAAVALAWLAGRPGVVAPVASARTPEQLAAILRLTRVQLSAEDVRRLDAVSAPTAREV